MAADRRSWTRWIPPALLVAGAVALLLIPGLVSGGRTLSYSAFLRDVGDHSVSTATIGADGTVTGTLKDGSAYTTVVPTAAPDTGLVARLEKAGVTISATAASSGSIWSTILDWALLLGPLVLIVWLWRRASRQVSGAGGLFGIGRSPAKLFTPDARRTTFADVAGYEGVKSEVAEVVDFLKNPARYARLGAVAPRGELLVGPPGTGKTLLARAVAGEAGVPFYSVDGSAFVEMFVGVGASRVRDLFATVRAHAPAILFIDEIDAIGQKRSGVREFAANDEREQTLNQLLAELDGFTGSTGVVVLAATNRPEVLDHALLRPGRFDRRIVVPLPNVAERTAILGVHCTGKPLGATVDLEAVARKTPGFSGADLANLANEAAITAVREGRPALVAADFDAARDRVVLGRRDSSTILLPDEKQRIADHEAGHALVAALCPTSDPVDRITILPTGQALGFTEQLPVEERHLQGEARLHDILATRLGGRAAELVLHGEGSTGAADDLAAATALATRMVREWGLSATFGPVGYPVLEDAAMSGATLNRPFSEATQRELDAEVSRLVAQAAERARRLLAAHRAVLETLSARLREAETLDGAVVYELLRAAAPDAVAAP